MPYDPTKMADWEIARAAEGAMLSPRDWQERLGLRDEEVLPYGRVAKLHGERILARLAGHPRGKYVAVTAITPTPLGEGKTTTTLGLIEGLAQRGLRAGGAIRQPSGGPSMNVKGTAAGGGNALLIPMTEFTLGLTGDIDAVTNAHNLALVALTARILHEANYSDEALAKRGLRRLDIDPRRVEMKWAIDFCAQALRHVVIGLGGRKDGVPMESGFQIAVSSELMAILAIARNLGDLRRRIGEITVAYSRGGKPVTCEDLEVAGAMAAWMRGALHPTLCSTIEYQPVLVHAGPFANIALGQSSILADELGLRLWDYHVTESGFGADVGFEKLWNVKCRLSGLTPDAVVLTATVRALKAHGGGPRVVPGHPLPKEYAREDLALVENGIPNLLHHLGIVRRAGVPAVVCLNRFPTDTDREVALVRRAAERAGARFAVGEHWLRGGEGALDLADAVVEACGEKKNFGFLYPLETPLRERVERIAREVYGADGVSWSPEAEEKARAFEADPRFRDYATVMVKTHLSLSHDPDLKGVPRGWTLPIRDVLLFSGARFLCPVAGEISLMPGTGSDPAFRRIDVDPETGEVRGLF